MGNRQNQCTPSTFARSDPNAGRSSGRSENCSNGRRRGRHGCHCARLRSCCVASPRRKVNISRARNHTELGKSSRVRPLWDPAQQSSTALGKTEPQEFVGTFIGIGTSAKRQPRDKLCRTAPPALSLGG